MNDFTVRITLDTPGSGGMTNVRVTEETGATVFFAGGYGPIVLKALSDWLASMSAARWKA